MCNINFFSFPSLSKGIFPASYIHLKEAIVEGKGWVSFEKITKNPLFYLRRCYQIPCTCFLLVKELRCQQCVFVQQQRGCCQCCHPWLHLHKVELLCMDAKAGRIDNWFIFFVAFMAPLTRGWTSTLDELLPVHLCFNSWFQLSQLCLSFDLQILLLLSDVLKEAFDVRYLPL